MRLPWLLGGVLVLLAAIYGPHIRSASFVYEDARLVDGTARPWSWAGMPRGRGLTVESWTLIRTPGAAHALNLALHLLVATLAGLLLWQLTGRGAVAAGVAAIVALHPLSIEGVAYAASRAELIAAVGALLALLAATAPVPWTWAAVPACLALAYLGKESGLVVLALIPLALWLQGDRLGASRGAWLGLGLVVTALIVAAPAVGIWTAQAEYGAVAINPDAWAAQQAVALWRIVVLSVVPVWLSVAPDVSAASGAAQAAAAVLLAGLAEIAWRLRTTAPLATFGLVWCALVVAPRFLVRTPGSPLNEHQVYLALPGIACCWMAALDARRGVPA